LAAILVLGIAVAVPWDIYRWAARRPWTWLLAEIFAACVAIRIFGSIALRGVWPSPLSPRARRATAAAALVLLGVSGILDVLFPPEAAFTGRGHWVLLWAIAFVIAVRTLISARAER